jgi:Kef-type K+ transport system membrane component KefB
LAGPTPKQKEPLWTKVFAVIALLVVLGVRLLGPYYGSLSRRGSMALDIGVSIGVLFVVSLIVFLLRVQRRHRKR